MDLLKHYLHPILQNDKQNIGLIRQLLKQVLQQLQKGNYNVFYYSSFKKLGLEDSSLKINLAAH